MPDIKPIQQNIDLGGLYPNLTPEELAEAEYNLTRYVEVVRRIYERVNNLTESDWPSTL
jgi:coenzyme F420-reducing hydrogenase alpha subunit